MATQKVIHDRDVWPVIAGYLFPAGIPPEPELVAEAVTKFIGGYPDSFIPPPDGQEVDGPLTLVWDHDFTQAEHDAWDRLVKMCRRRSEYDDAGMAGVEAAESTLRAWNDRTPGAETQEQMVAVLDAMTDLWRAELRDD